MAPRLKPLTDEKELAAIPLGEPVLVELEPPATGAEVDPDEREEQPARRERRQEEGDEPEAVAALRKQVDDMRTANAAETARITRERDDAIRQAREAREQNSDTETDLIATSLASAQSDALAAKQAVKAAFDAGDSGALADAQERLGRAAADIREFERAAAAQSARKDADAKAEKDAAERPPQQFASVEAAIDARSDLTDAERNWLKTHQDAWVDPTRNQELGVAYRRAVSKGLTRGTPGYFQFIEQFMGYADADQGAGHEEDPDNSRSAIVSAPVSRENRSSMTGRELKPSQIRLTPEQRELARNMGLSDVQYAKGVRQLDQNKKSDPERYAGR